MLAIVARHPGDGARIQRQIPLGNFAAVTTSVGRSTAATSGATAAPAVARNCRAQIGAVVLEKYVAQ